MSGPAPAVRTEAGARPGPARPRRESALAGWLRVLREATVQLFVLIALVLACKMTRETPVQGLRESHRLDREKDVVDARKEEDREALAAELGGGVDLRFLQPGDVVAAQLIDHRGERLAIVERHVASAKKAGAKVLVGFRPDDYAALFG